MYAFVGFVFFRVTSPLAVVAFVALASPVAASGHIRTSVVAVDDRVVVFSLPAPVRSAVSARVFESDQALGLTAKRGHAVVVLGYTGEPFLRIDAEGVAVNAASPTAAAVGLLRPTQSSVGRAPDWRLRSSRRTAVWQDARLRSLPPGVSHSEWRIPLLVDGRRVRLEGEIRRVPAPSPWPWLGLGLPFVVAAALLLSRYRSQLRGAVVGLGVAAAAGTFATATAFAMGADAGPNASTGRWIEGGYEVAFVLVGLAVVAFGPATARPIAGGALGLLGLAVGLTKLPVFLHGVVLSPVPAAVARASVVLAIAAGFAAATVGVAVFFELLESPDEALARYRQIGRPS
jgi:hypothetical protein